MWVSSQLANAAALYLWGRLSDRLSNKAILAVALPLYFISLLGLVFAGAGATGTTQLALLYLLHVLMGIATGGIGLATGNIGLKLAPQGKGTSYLAAIGTVSAVLGKSGMEVSQLLKLGRGTIVELDRKVGEAIDIYVNDRLVARGEVVLVEDRLGITMTEIIKAGSGS